MSGRSLPRALAFGAVLLVLFSNLGGSRLFDRDEALNATCGREMFERGDLVVPTFNGELRTAKPALVYWLMSASYSMFGVSEFAARFFSAVASVGTVLCVFLIGRRLFDERTGLISGVVLVTSVLFTAVGRACTPDPFLMFGFTLAMFGFVNGVVQRNGRFGPADEASRLPRRYVPRSSWLVFTFVAMGLAVLAKGPVGVVLPVGILGLYLLWSVDARDERSGPDAKSELRWWRRAMQGAVRFLSPARIWSAGWALQPMVLVIVVSLIAVPWYVAVGLRTDGAWLRTFLGHDNVGRFLRPMEGHGGPFFYYVPAILIGFCPWALFLPAAVVHGGKRLRDRQPDADAFRFLFCWAGLVVLFFSLAGTKLPNYVLPAYPAMALLVGVRLSRWWDSLAVGDRGFGFALALLEWSTLAFLFGLPIAAHYLVPGHAGIGLVAVLPLIGLGYTHHAWRTKQSSRAVATLLAGSVCFTFGLFSFAAPAVSSLQDGVLLGRAAFDVHGEHVRVGAFRYFSPNLVFYSGGTVDRIHTTERVAEFLDGDTHALLVVPEERLPELDAVLPKDIQVLARHREFLENRNVVLLGRGPAAAAAAAGRAVRR